MSNIPSISATDGQICPFVNQPSDLTKYLFSFCDSKSLIRVIQLVCKRWQHLVKENCPVPLFAVQILLPIHPKNISMFKDIDDYAYRSAAFSLNLLFIGSEKELRIFDRSTYTQTQLVQDSVEAGNGIAVQNESLIILPSRNLMVSTRKLDGELVRKDDIGGDRTLFTKSSPNSLGYIAVSSNYTGSVSLMGPNPDPITLNLPPNSGRNVQKLALTDNFVFGVFRDANASEWTLVKWDFEGNIILSNTHMKMISLYTHKDEVIINDSNGTKIFDESLNEMFTIPVNYPIYKLVSHGDSIYICDNKGKVEIWDLKEYKKIKDFRSTSKIMIGDAAFSGNIFFCNGINRSTIEMWLDGEYIGKLKAPKGIKNFIVDKKDIVATLSDGSVCIWSNVKVTPPPAHIVQEEKVPPKVQEIKEEPITPIIEPIEPPKPSLSEFKSAYFEKYLQNKEVRQIISDYHGAEMNKLCYVIYRIWQGFLSIFGCSDWQDAHSILLEEAALDAQISENKLKKVIALQIEQQYKIFDILNNLEADFDIKIARNKLDRIIRETEDNIDRLI